MSDAMHSVPPPVYTRPPRRWLTIVLLVCLVFSFLANGILFLGLAAMAVGKASVNASERVGEEVITAGGREKIAILPVNGAIDEQTVELFRRFVRSVEADPEVRAIVLEIDSPGGGVTASDEIYHLLLNLRTHRSIPILVSMRALAASGGYYIAMAGQKLYAQPTTLTGSIGVIWPAMEFSGLLEKIGVTPEIITSDEARYKDAASPFRKFSDRDRLYIKGLVNQAHERFKSIVVRGREGQLKVPADQIAIGRVWTAGEALKLGLIDQIAYLDDVLQEAARQAGLSHPTVVRLKERKGLLELLDAKSPASRLETHIQRLDALRSPSLEYRWMP